MGRKKITEIIEYEYFCDACSKPFNHGDNADVLVLIFEDESYHNGDIFENNVSVLLCPSCKDKVKKDIKNMTDLNIIYNNYSKYTSKERVGQLFKSKWKKEKINNFEILK